MSLATAAEYELLLAAGDPTTPQAPAELSQLCPREHELVALVRRGSTNAQIAIQLHISVRAVGSHLDRIRDKTGCRRRTDLTRMALQAGLAWSAGKPGPGSPPCPVPAVGRSIPPRPRRKGVIPPAERGESGPCHGGARSASLYLRPQNLLPAPTGRRGPMWADAHADRQEDSMNGTKLNSVVKAAFVAAAMFAATAAVASASAPSAEAAAGTSVLQAAGDSSGQLSLPIPAGETWTLTQGPHNTNGGAQNAVSPLSSLDLSGGSGHVVAARDGVVESVAAACRGKTPAQANLVVINHGDGWHTSYYHIPNVQVVVGQHVASGQYLGNIGTGTGCGGSADGAHVHFSVEYYTSGSYSWQTGEVDLRGRSIGGWTFQGANWNGYAVRNSDGRTVYSGHNGLVDQVITGGGTPGSTSSSPSSVLDNHGNPVIYFRGTNNLLQQTHWVAGQGWVTDSNSGVAMAGNPSAVDAQGNPVIYFRGTNNLLQQTHWVTGQGWVTDSPSDLPSGVSF